MKIIAVKVFHLKQLKRRNLKRFRFERIRIRIKTYIFVVILTLFFKTRDSKVAYSDIIW